MHIKFNFCIWKSNFHFPVRREKLVAAEKVVAIVILRLEQRLERSTKVEEL